MLADHRSRRIARIALSLIGLLVGPATLSAHEPSIRAMQESPDADAALPARDPSLLVPPPVELVIHDAVFLLGSHSTVIVDANAVSAHPIATRLARMLRTVSGQAVPIQLGDAGDGDFGAWVVRLRPERSELGAEGYRLRIEPEQLRLVAATPEGLSAGLSTLRQLLPAETQRAVHPPREILLPCLRLQDAPGVQERGLVLEIGDRVPEEEVLVRLVQQLGRHKLNRLRLTGGSKQPSQELQDEAQREGVQLLVGERDAGSTTGADLRLTAPTDWAAATALPELGGAPGRVEASLALDEVPPDTLDAWLWPRLMAVAEAAWTSPTPRAGADFAKRLLPHLERLSAEGVAWFVPAPERLGAQGVFAGTLDIPLRNPGPLGRVHVTTDGTEPTTDSPVVDDVLTLDGSATVRARVFVADGHGSAELAFDVRRESALAAATDAPELLAPGMSWAPELLRPTAFPAPFTVLHFEGWLDVPLSGAYSFHRDDESGGRCLLTLGAGPARLSFELPAADQAPIETLLEQGLHRARLDWWPAPSDATPQLAWQRTGPQATARADLPWLTPPLPPVDDDG